MTGYVLRLFTDRFAPRAALNRTLAPANRCLFVAEGLTTIAGGGAVATLAAQSGWFHAGATDVAAGPDGAALLRYELANAAQAGDGIAIGEGIESDLTHVAELMLDDPDGYLMRLDTVDLPPGCVAYTHTHQGGGIRCLLEGGFVVDVDGKQSEIRPFEAWFERGPDPVRAWAPDDKPGRFARVMILPRRLKGQSSIAYVNPEDAGKPKLQKYAMFVDEYIEI